MPGGSAASSGCRKMSVPSSPGSRTRLRAGGTGSSGAAHGEDPAQQGIAREGEHDAHAPDEQRRVPDSLVGPRLREPQPGDERVVRAVREDARPQRTRALVEPGEGESTEEADGELVNVQVREA